MAAFSPRRLPYSLKPTLSVAAGTAPAHIAYDPALEQFRELRLPSGGGPFPVAIGIHGGSVLASMATMQFTAAFADSPGRAGIATWNVEYCGVDAPGSGWPEPCRDIGRAADHVRPLPLRVVVTLGADGDLPPVAFVLTTSYRAFGDAHVTRARAKAEALEVMTLLGAGHFDVANPTAAIWPTIQDVLLSLVKRPRKAEKEDTDGGRVRTAAHLNVHVKSPTNHAMTEFTLRTDPAIAADALAALLPDAALRRAVAEVIASSIRFAHAQAPASWELTAWPDFVRLNVGQIAVLEVNSNEVFLYTVAGSPLANAAYRMIEFDGYRAVPVPTERWGIPLAEVARLRSELWKRHRALVRAASRAKRVSPFQRAHSPGAVAAIAHLTGDVLPRPAYADEPGFAPAKTEDDGSAAGVLFGLPEANRDVEQAAVHHATARLTAEGWQVRSVEGDRCGYDLDCQRRGKKLHVEVKGVRSEPTHFVITAGEVRRAETDRCFALILVGWALNGEPTLERWSGRDLLRAFALEPLQYVARRSAT